MATATLGGLIKDYRLRKRLSQLDISLRIGWSDTTRLSKIEQGRVGKPTLETVEKIIKALDLNEQEKGEFLLAGGYLPSDEDIKRVIKLIKERADKWKYPVQLIDFAWRNLYMNGPMAISLGIPANMIEWITKQKSGILEFALAPKNVIPVDIFRGDDEDHLKPFSEAVVLLFKAQHLGRENEDWYKKMINKLAVNEDFRKLWSNVNIDDYKKVLLNYEYKLIKMPGKAKAELRFHVTSSRILQDERFQLVTYYPADEFTTRYFNGIK